MFQSDFMPLPDTDGGVLAVLIARASQSVTRAFEMELAPFGISVSQYVALNVLAASGDTTIGNLVRQSRMDSGAMTRMLDRMEAIGVVVRQSDLNDRRVVRLAITEYGYATLPLMAAAVARVHDALMRGYSHEDLDRFRSYLSVAIENASSVQEAA
jgi:DNA-binding MarR family transcriptional regulator